MVTSSHWKDWMIIRRKMKNAGIEPGYVRRINLKGWDIWGIRKTRSNIRKGILNYRISRPIIPSTLRKALDKSNLKNIRERLNEKIIKGIFTLMKELYNPLDSYFGRLITRKGSLVIYDIGYGYGDTTLKFLEHFIDTALENNINTRKSLGLHVYIINTINNATYKFAFDEIMHRYKYLFNEITITSQPRDIHSIKLPIKNEFLPDVILLNESLNKTPIMFNVVRNLMSILAENSRIYSVYSFIGVGEWTHGLWLIPELTIKFSELLYDVKVKKITPTEGEEELWHFIHLLSNKLHIKDNSYVPDVLLMVQLKKGLAKLARFWFELAHTEESIGPFLDGSLPPQIFFGQFMDNMKSTDRSFQAFIDNSTLLHSITAVAISP